MNAKEGIILDKEGNILAGQEPDGPFRGHSAYKATVNVWKPGRLSSLLLAIPIVALLLTGLVAAAVIGVLILLFVAIRGFLRKL